MKAVDEKDQREDTHSITTVLSASADNDKDRLATSYESQPGLLEEAANLNNATNEAKVSLEQISRDTNIISQLFEDATKRVSIQQARNNDARMVLPIVQKPSRDLLPVATDYDRKSNIFLDSIVEMDAGLRIVIDVIDSWPEGDTNTPIEGLSELINAAEESKSQVLGFLASISDVSRVSRSLSKPLAILNRATTNQISASDMILEWQEFSA